MVYFQRLFDPFFFKTRTRFIITNGELETSSDTKLTMDDESGSIHGGGEKAKAILDFYPRTPSFMFIPTINRHVELQNARMEMEVKSDRISNLPEDIIDLIVSLLSIRDAVRTSVLSSKWRYRWAYTNGLFFDDEIFQGSSKEIMRRKLANAIFHILLLHKGPLIDFSLCVELKKVSKIDLIFLYLSRTNTFKKLELLNRSTKHYELPFSFFLLQGLHALELTTCVFEPPPLTFKGFSELTWLGLENVKITLTILKRLLTNCPLLETFYLHGAQKDITTNANKGLTLAELIECLPSIVTLAISQSYMKYFGSGGIPHKLPIPPIHLKALYLGARFMEHEELLSTLCLIKSSPNLEKVYLRVSNEPLHYSQPTSSVDFMGIKDHSSFKFDHLKELWMVNFSNLPIEMEFLKLVMSKSPVLEKVIIELHDKIPIVEKLKMYTHQLQFPFPRPSSSTKLIVRRSNNEESIILSM